MIIKLEFESGGELPRWVGSYLYKGLRYYMRRIVCERGSGCSGCDFSEECPYFQIYVKDFSSVRKSPPVRPVFLVPPYFSESKRVDRGYILDIRLLIFRGIEEWIPYLILALNELGKQGLVGSNRNNRRIFKVKEIINSGDGGIVYDGRALYTNRITIYNSEDIYYKLGGVIEIDFWVPMHFPGSGGLENLLGLIRSRLTNLEREYGVSKQIPEYRVDYRVIKSDIDSIKLNYRRGDIKFKINAIIGAIKYEINEMDKIANWLLSLGAHIGAGKYAVFGCGFYKIKNENGSYFE